MSKDIHIVKDMNLKLQKKKSNRENYFIDKNINLACITNDNKDDNHLLSIKYNDVIYTIIYNGKIYNKNEIKKELEELDYDFSEHSDTEVLLKGFIHFGSKLLKKLNGAFSFVIWNDKTKEVFLVRDHLGISPLYYTAIDNTIIFSTEIKGILKYPKVEVIVDRQGINEMFGLRTSTYSRNYYIQKYMRIGTCTFFSV